MRVANITAPRDRELAGARSIATAQPPELRLSPFGGALTLLHSLLRGPGAAAARRLLRRLLAHLEGGEMRSATLRRIMREQHGIEIGAHSYGCFDPVRFPSGTCVGRYVAVGPAVAVYRRNHPIDRLSMHPYFYNPHCGAHRDADVGSAPLEIGADAWLGAHAIILPGCRRIGAGAVVAAGAVVTRDVPDYAVVGGNPARTMRLRFDADARAAAELSRWWESPPDVVAGRFDMSAAWQGKVAGASGSESV